MASVSVLPPPDAAPARAASLRPRSRQARSLRVWLAVLAVGFALALRLIPVDLLRPLDGGRGRDIVNHPISFGPPQHPETFPGSAYFFAQDAFAPVGAIPAEDGNPNVTTLSPDGNSQHIFQIERGPMALSMPVRGATFLDQARALQCMTNAIYYEAGNEPEEGQRAVAQVILNRMASGRWPASVCGVIYQGTERSDRRCQFTFSCDGSMARTPVASSWARARRIAARALSGETFGAAGLATFYHTLAVRPTWADRVRPIAVIGAHIFYRLPGRAGTPGEYGMRYAGRESAQPGPYAFSPPARAMTFPVPPGPDLIEAWGTASLSGTMVQTGTPPPPVMATPAMRPQDSYSYAPASVASSAPSASPGLPQSTIRPEFRNSGRILR